MSLSKAPTERAHRRAFVCLGALTFALLIIAGVFAKNGWFPSTDPFSGKKTGWFGRPLAKNAESWNPFAAPPPPPTPQLSKEYIYASGSRLLAVEDANATAAPPADLAVWRPTGGLWMIMGQQGSQATNFSWGVSTDIPVPGDYDGDGKTDFSVFRPSEGKWYVMRSSDAAWQTYSWGVSTDIPVPADYEGDGKTDAAVMRPNQSTGNSEWWIYKSSDSSWLTFTWGTNTDLPGPADFDGDGRADVAVYRASTQMYYSINSSNAAFQYIPLNQTGNKTVSSDYDGDGRADHAIYNSATATWTIRYSSSGQVATIQWGSSNDLPVHNDYDGDGKCDLATWTTSNARPRW